MSITPEHEHQENRISPRLAADLRDRLLDLDTASSGAAFALDTPRDFLNRATELMCADNPRGALETLLDGWGMLTGLRERGDAAADPETVLTYLGALIDCAEQSKDDDASAAWRERRIELLTELGRTMQAGLERVLGPLAFRQPTAETVTEIEPLAAPLGADEPQALDLRVLYGLCLQRAGRHTDAIAVLEGVHDLAERLGHAESQVLARFLVEDSYVQIGDEETALAYIHDIVRLSDNRAMIAMMLMKRAQLAAGAPSKTPAVLFDLVNALELFAACGIRPGAIMAAMAMGGLLSENAAHEAAAAAYGVALDEAERAEHPLGPQIAVSLGNALLQAEEPARGAAVLSRFLDTPEPVDGSQAAERAAALATLGHAKLAEGEAAEAYAAWSQASGRFLAGGDHTAAAAAASNCGKICAAAGKMDEARAWAEKALQASQEAGEHPLQAAEHSMFLASVMARQGDQDSLEIVDAALEIAVEYEAEFHAAQFAETRGSVLHALGQTDDAIAAILRAADAYASVSLSDEGTRCDIRAADLLRSEGRDVEAASVYRSAIDRDVDRPDYLFAAYKGLSQALGSLGQDLEASAARAESESWAARARAMGLSLD
ncbi:hypothetical protein [Falsarthrobacter nasiphocae]|uniref:Tetratricopeptide (TPR) repeat protein n=1 Tax=Falsarthrobacter nasiphocae TaxID=189863 RepID=A0AAE4C5R2_9MICC|nr:hypothetical protein [Falsarthrobacter nasiphocae]MDR6892581.1 tetratricopeptide (TPR) repeat protein [Falsarthrobacter nasiphocae]